MVGKNVSIGLETKVWNFSNILDGARIGNNCVIGSYVELGPGVSIGNDVWIQNGVNIYAGVTLEDNVFCGPACMFTNVHNPRAGVPRKNEFGKTLVKKGASIGANALIVCGKKGDLRTIGKYASVGGGAVVTNNVAYYALVVGVPAKQIGWECECGEVWNGIVDAKNIRKLECSRCGLKYRHFGMDFKKISN